MLKRAVLLLALAGCSTPSSPTSKPDAPPVIQAENPEWAKIAEEAVKGMPAEDQRKMVEADAHFHLALAFFNRADFDRAKEEAQRCIQLWPEHYAARDLLNDVNGIIVGGPVALRDFDHRWALCFRVKVQQALLEIENHVRQGGRYMDARMYDKALREFENAEFKIVNMPGDTPSLNDLLPKVRAMLARAKSSLKD